MQFFYSYTLLYYTPCSVLLRSRLLAKFTSSAEKLSTNADPCPFLPGVERSRAAIFVPGQVCGC